MLQNVYHTFLNNIKSMSIREMNYLCQNMSKKIKENIILLRLTTTGKKFKTGYHMMMCEYKYVLCISID